MIIQELLKKTYSKKQLDPPEIDELLALTLHKKLEYIYKNSDKELSISSLKKFNKLLEKRLNKWPLAYLKGNKEFYNLNFLVNKNILVPRPASELLVDEALKYLKKIKNPNIIDIGTGSGCLIIAIAKNNSEPAKYLASDIASSALQIAKTNARKLQLKNKIKFIKSDLLKNIPQQKFNIIIANLPYLTPAQMKETSISREPKQALIAGQDGLDYYLELLKQLPNYLNKKYLILLEIDPQQEKKIDHLIKKYLPDGKIQFLKDLNKDIRVVKIQN